MTDRPRLSLERAFTNPIDEVWELWTTKAGIESWWGPEGFSVAVRELDLRPGGRLVYVMSATGRDQIEYMKKSGMPLTTEQHVVYEEVAPPRRLLFRSLADFIPGVEPYEVDTLVELHEVAGGVRMVLSFEAMHDEHWTNLMVMGKEGEVRRLEALLAARS
ncbi:MAG TPA: SRPBCC domain-containing protein [Myxococcaceae bacterium]